MISPVQTVDECRQSFLRSLKQHTQKVLQRGHLPIPSISTCMAEVAVQNIIPSTTPVRAFEKHENSVLAVAVFPDGRRMVTGSRDRTLRLWNLNDGVLLKKMEGHRSRVSAVAISRDGQLIASGDNKGVVIAWHGDSGESLAQAIKAHCWAICSLDISPDGTVLATGSSDNTTKLWNTKTWQLQGKPIECGDEVNCVRYSPSGEHLAIATFGDIQIWNSSTRECIANFEGHAVISRAYNASIEWTPDGTRLLSAGTYRDPTIREWDSSTWKQVGNPWHGHSHFVDAIAVNSTGTLLASASYDNHVRLWRLSDKQTIAIFQHSDPVCRVTFSADGKHILSGGNDKKILQWAVPEAALEQASNVAQDFHSKILVIDAAVRYACIAGDLSTAEALLTREIEADDNDYTSYANRSFVMARKSDWDRALDDAVKSVSIQPSLTGYITMAIALCGQMQVQDGMQAFDLTFMFSNEDLKTVHFILLIKAIVLFNANKHQEAMLRVQQLAAACPSVDNVACHIVQAYLHLQLGIDALDNACHNEAVDHFTAALNSSHFSSKLAAYSIYEDLTVLFGWDLKSLWKTANQKLCHALLRASRLGEALESYRYMMDMSDQTTKASCLDWSAAFEKECSILHSANGDAALAACDYDEAIKLYSIVIDLNYADDVIFANRSKAKLEKMQWEDALIDAQKVIDLNPLSDLGHQLKYAALHGAQLYDEANEAFQIMLSKSDNAPDMQIRRKPKIRHGCSTVSQQSRQQHVMPEAEGAIRKAIHTQLDNAPLRLLHTSTGLLCDREAQIIAFKSSTEYKELLSSTTKYANLRKERIEEVVVMYFRRAMLSHRWEGKEPLLHDIQDKDVYKLNPVAGIMKLRSFCEIARNAGYHWAWIDTCCIDKHNNAELQESLNSMFVWYRHAALTIVYLSDVLPSPKPGALARSAWIKRGWTVPEFLASEVVLFYQKDWTLYLDDHSSNHKESTAIMQELEDMTGINPQALVAFRPGMRDAREKFRWASTRDTTLQEDVAYSLFGIFDVQLRVNYGEKKQNALGRLSQEIVAQSGDITVLDWVGKSSEFNSCLPADITSYEAPPFTLSSLSEDEMQKSVSSLRHAVSVESAVGLYRKLDHLSAPRFAHRRLHLPCIAFPVTEVKRRPGQDQATYFTYEVKSDGLHDLQITTEDRLIQFSRARPTRQTFLLVRPWDRYLLELPDFADDTQNTEDWSAPESPSHEPPGGSPGENEHVDSESHSRALQLLVHLGQPFGAFLLAQQRGGEYKRIASDHDIIAQIQDMTSVMDVRTLEIL